MTTDAARRPAPVAPRPPRGVRPADVHTSVDRAFAAVTSAAGMLVLALLAAVAGFLFWQARPALTVEFFTTVTFQGSLDPPVIGVVGLLIGTVVVAAIAVAIAVPISVLTALFITDVATARLRSLMIGLVDLLAAIPSLLYGLWGFSFLRERVVPLSAFLSDHLGFVPVLRVDRGAEYVQSYFIAGLVVSLMTLPIITSVAREVFSQVPPAEKEAALALGSTRWGMLRTVVLPFGRAGIVGGSMLGLGRALGETIAVSLLLPQSPTRTVHIFQYGGSTTAGFIANNNGFTGLALHGLLAAGLVLFGFTLATNFAASIVVSRSRSGVGVDS